VDSVDKLAFVLIHVDMHLLSKSRQPTTNSRPILNQLLHKTIPTPGLLSKDRPLQTP
jgi:hypothetical protein